MAKVLCPYCGERARLAPRLFGLPYCVRCGWRLQDAETSSKQLSLILSLVALIGLVGFVRTVILGWPIVIDCLFLTCFVVMPGVLVTLSWLDYQQIVVAEPQTVTPRPEDWLVRATAEYQPLLNLSVPRAVQVSWKGWLRITVTAGCLGLVFYRILASGVPEHVGLGFVLQRLREQMLPVSVLIAIGGFTSINLVRQRWSHVPLFESGNVAVGRILQQKYQNITVLMDLIGRYSVVEYEFRDHEGLPVGGGGHDYTKSLFQEMPAVVFYDPKGPLLNVALGCSLYELKSRK